MEKYFQARRDRLSRMLRRSKLDLFLVNNLTNLYYLTGFSGSAGYLVVSPEKAVLVSDFRYKTLIEQQCPDLQAEICGTSSETVDTVCKLLGSSNDNRIGFESGSVFFSAYERLAAKTSGNLVPTDGWIESLRSIKDKHELALIRKSVEVNERAFRVILAQLAPDQTELQIAHNLEHQMRAFGASKCAFEPLVCVGERAALPHGKPSAKRVGDGAFLMIDWGTEFQGYSSDLTRIVVTGKITSKLRKVYDIVLQAQMAAIKKIRPGVSTKEVDSAARSVIDKAGYGKYFGHGLGHGFGLEIHELPYLSPARESVLQKNMVVTVEPGIYLPGWGGVRIEDDILVTSNGYEVLSHLPKQLDECVVKIG